MTVKSAWAIVETDYKNRISFIEDIANQTGGMTITNDAENVLLYFYNSFGLNWRVVYKDTDNEWWEIVPSPLSFPNIHFKPWHGLVWDILQRKD